MEANLILVKIICLMVDGNFRRMQILRLAPVNYKLLFENDNETLMQIAELIKQHTCETHPKQPSNG